MVVWLALAFFLVAIGGGLAFAVVRGLALRRDAKRSAAALGAEVERINEVSSEIERQLQRAEGASGRLQAARVRLAASREQLDVQRAALREARSQVKKAFWFVPGL